MKDEKFCESCGMPLRKNEDFGGGKLDNKHCVHCCDDQGKLKSYDQVLLGMKQFMIQNMGVSEEESLISAKENMAKMPAWAERK